MILFFISFIAGVLTVLAPCILPLLPIVVGGSLSDGKVNIKKALTIIISLGLSVILFTLLLKVSTLFINIPEEFWKWFSGSIVTAIGLVMLFPALWETQIMARLSARANMALGSGERRGGFWGNVTIGAALGPVFSTCSPTYFIVLATVLPVNPILGVFYLLTYTIGLSLALLLVAFLGQKIMDKLNVAADPRGWIKRIIGVLFILVGIAIISGFDKELQTRILNSGFFDVTQVEQRLLESNEKSKEEMGDILESTGLAPESADSEEQNMSKVQEENANSAETANSQTIQTKNIFPLLSLAQKSAKYKLAPELVNPDGYINTDSKPITLAELKSKKVVLVDIWTYSCINCQRTLPYLKDWYQKYEDQGLEIVAVHTPEFAFEKVQKNVEAAVKRFGLNYPVVLDNEYATWNAFGNRYWPRKYLIDIDGYIVYDHIGEGGYTETEKQIQDALMERSERLKTNISLSDNLVKDTTVIQSESPETYFGAFRNNTLGNGIANKEGMQTFTAPTNIQSNILYLDGTWNIQREYAESQGPGKIIFKYKAKDIYFVGSSTDGVKVSIYQDGIFQKNITIKEDTLYTLIQNPKMQEHTIEIRVTDQGLKAFTFTFG